MTPFVNALQDPRLCKHGAKEVLHNCGGLGERSRLASKYIDRERLTNYTRVHHPRILLMEAQSCEQHRELYMYPFFACPPSPPHNL